MCTKILAEVSHDPLYLSNNRSEIVTLFGMNCYSLCYIQVTNLKGLSNGGKPSSPLHTSWESPPSYQQAGNITSNTKYGSVNTSTNNSPVNATGRSLPEVWNV